MSSTSRSSRARAASRPVRRSVSLRADLDQKVRRLAEKQNRSASSVLESLVEAGLNAKDAERRRFFEVAERYREATQPADIQAAKRELAHLIFGE